MKENIEANFKKVGKRNFSFESCRATYYTFCSVCFSNFGIGHRVRNNVTNHIGGSMHKKHVAATKNQKLSD